MSNQRQRVVILGGGAAGFFGAIRAAELLPQAEIWLLERGREVLQKVRISGGGRCNVTHACFVPKDLVKFYPRGSRELLGPFHKFAPGDTMGWFEDRKVKLKIEDDGRVFPASDSSASIVDCLMREATRLKIKVRTSCRVEQLEPLGAPAHGFRLQLAGGEILHADALLLATGSSPLVWAQLEKLGHTIVPPVPSLFTFNIKSPHLRDLEGTSLENAALQSAHDKTLRSDGALLITHWGLSGPAALRLSAWGARALHQLDYRFSLCVNWVYPYTAAECMESFLEYKQEHPKRQLKNYPQYQLPTRLWERLLEIAEIPPARLWADITRKELQRLCEELTRSEMPVNGKSTFKDEFVTAGGVSLPEIDFTNFASRVVPGLFLAGEVLDIDAITGGFNFQAAWTGGWLAGGGIAEYLQAKA